MRYVKESLTSYQGAVDNLPRAGTQKARILKAITEWSEMPDEGATRDQLEVITGLSGNAVRPRVAELIEAGLVKETERTRKTRSGSQAAVLVVNVGVGAEGLVSSSREARGLGGISPVSTDSGVADEAPISRPSEGATAPPDHCNPYQYEVWA